MYIYNINWVSGHRKGKHRLTHKLWYLVLDLFQYNGRVFNVLKDVNKIDICIQLFLFIINIRKTPDFATNKPITFHWRHNNHDGVSNLQPHGCLLNRLFGRRSKKTSELRVTGLCAGKSPGSVNSPHKWPVTRKMFPFDDVIMNAGYDYRELSWSMYTNIKPGAAECLCLQLHRSVEEVQFHSFRGKICQKRQEKLRTNQHKDKQLSLDSTVAIAHISHNYLHMIQKANWYNLFPCFDVLSFPLVDKYTIYPMINIGSYTNSSNTNHD